MPLSPSNSTETASSHYQRSNYYYTHTLRLGRPQLLFYNGLHFPASGPPSSMPVLDASSAALSGFTMHPRRHLCFYLAIPCGFSCLGHPTSGTYTCLLSLGLEDPLNHILSTCLLHDIRRLLLSQWRLVPPLLHLLGYVHQCGLHPVPSMGVLCGPTTRPQSPTSHQLSPLHLSLTPPVLRPTTRGKLPISLNIYFFITLVL